eukprot:TRINITY_DN298_c0_g1_i5.p1 TRINITY_DN298_c0_g1~~TRINITY_DN298_c0_g1_i5.p1  ORF type:complete len:598 (+),score=173.57 TRINITY_DN298_c0_g1_i5:342-2135(+)
MPTPKKSKTVYDGLRRAFGYCETCTENFRVASEGEETEDVCEACIHSLQMHCGRKIITLECFKQMVKFMKPDRLPWVIERVGVYRWHPSHLDKKYLYGMKRGVTQKKYKGVDCKDFKSHSCKSVAPAFEPTLPAEEIEEEDELDVELFVEENVAEEPPLMRRRLEENLNDKDSDDSDFDLDDESYEESEDFSESSDSEPDSRDLNEHGCVDMSECIAQIYDTINWDDDFVRNFEDLRLKHKGNFENKHFADWIKISIGTHARDYIIGHLAPHNLSPEHAEIMKASPPTTHMIEKMFDTVGRIATQTPHSRVDTMSSVPYFTSNNVASWYIERHELIRCAMPKLMKYFYKKEKTMQEQEDDIDMDNFKHYDEVQKKAVFATKKRNERFKVLSKIELFTSESELMVALKPLDPKDSIELLKDQLRKLKAFQQMKLIGKNLVDLTQKVEIKKGDDRISRTLDCLTNKVIVAIDVLEMNGDLRKSDDRFNSLYGEAGSVSKPVAEEKKEASIGHSGYRMIHKSLLTHDVDYYRVKDDLEYNEKCEWCDQGGKIIECDRCNLVYHPYCLSPKFDEKNNAEDYLFCCCEEDWKEVQELSKKSF